MRNKGLHQYRFQNNPMEEKYAKAWEKENKSGSNDILDYLLAKDCNSPQDGEVSERDRLVAATVIQWLGSPVGQSFIEETQDKK
jgi:hypothetical protein